MSAEADTTTRPGARTALYRRLFAFLRDRDGDLQRFWIDPLASIPFRLGESLAEAKVPYAFDDALDRTAGQAVADLLDLFQRRFAPGREESELASGSARRQLREECQSPRYSPTGSLENRLSADAVRLDPHLDCGLLDSWTARGGPGARLLTALRDLVTRAAEAEIGARGEVPYVYLTLLAVADLLEQKKALAKAVALRSVGYERLEKAVGLALFGVVEAATRAALTPISQRELPVDLERTWLLARTALNPLIYISIKSRALQNDINPWSLSPEATPALERVYGEVLQQDAAPPTLERRFTAAVLASPEAAHAAARCGLRALIRDRIFGFLAEFDDGRTDWMRLLASLLRKDADLDAALGRSRAREALQQRVRGFGRMGRTGEAGARALSGLTEVLEAFARGDPTRQVVGGLPSPEALTSRGIAAYLAFTFDQFAAIRLEEVRGHLNHARETSEDPAVLAEAYEVGRLYRFSPDGRPFVKPLRRHMQGQLFIDLKGFTRRTYRAKEVVMADFMREQFYLPILGAARARCADLAWGGGIDRPIELHNLLGDAAAFAGAVSELVTLARDLQHIGQEYAGRLERAAPSLTAGRSLHAAEHDLRDAEAGAAAAAAELGAELTRARQAMAAKASLAPEEKARLLVGLFEERFAELDRLRQATMEQLSAAPEDSELLAYLERLASWEAELRWKEQRTRETLAALSDPERDHRLTDLLTRKEQQAVRDLEQQLERRDREAAVRRRLLEEQRRAVTGFGLETGVYISYGASAEVIAMDDEVFGALRVAISEKINEAARGTARNQEIKAKLDSHLEREKRRRGDHDVDWPFLVYVDSAYTLVLPPEVNETVERALRDRDRGAVDEAVRSLSQRLRDDLLRGMGAGDGKPPEILQPFNDIHNLGVALSEDALEAYLGETLARRFHFRKTVRACELHEDLQRRFAFLEDEIRLVISAAANRPGPGSEGVLIFRHAGDVQFRGFELKRATGVYELLAPEGPFVELLARHHLQAWLEEAREDPGRLITSLGHAA